ncbi:MAG: DNA-binding protein WhiA [Clostridia bacterium]|nr:DNA-binding protein WhiA [Clostridia bacterium]
MQNSGSFTSSIKTELASLRVRRESDARALLCAFTLGIGSLKFVPETRSWGVHYVIKSKEAVELTAKLASQYYGLECRLTEVRHERLNASYCELLLYGESISRFMLETGIMSRGANGETQFSAVIPKNVLRTETQIRMFMRGLFLACGMVTKPEKSYHAEFVLSNEALVRAAFSILSDHGIVPKLTKRRQSTVVYIKEGDKLEDLLAFIGASGAMMEVSNERILKQAKNEANRGVNCISANLERATRAAQRQAEDIRLVLDTFGTEHLDEDLAAVAEARMNNFELSLSELADELGIGRSAVNYRLGKLQKLADEIRNGTYGKSALLDEKTSGRRDRE